MKTEIYILGGFLGSGKTTLLTNLLQYEKENNRKVAVVMNEIGQISIDSTVVEDDTPLKELLNGCVCCSLQDQFEVQLEDLLRSNDLDVIYIETTGAAHPMEVYDACLSPIFANTVDMRGIISIVDLNRWKNREKLSLQIRMLLLEQIKHADVLLLNKMDLVENDEQAALLYEIQSINPKAKTFFTSFSKINPTHLLNTKLIKKEAYNAAHITKHLNMKSFVYTFQSSINRIDFENFLRSLPDNVFRIKGFIQFTDSTTIYSFQYSYGVPTLLPDLMKMPLTLVFIGESINQDKMITELQLLEQKNPTK
ncbi:CobW family GTP-binding protein [Bacillus solimangrovi]|uniref:Cobalamin biosynthesis protein n=1 Tax=Bacillus solimangrovi TaxID=1305675 RepID=A0A1E5LF72_9BACI|nr:GTP-binding protein [Bacillus solimangrovi]OEH92706.1 cobalamin biosynthesis protein [Bacillus solimangrovi]